MREFSSYHPIVNFIYFGAVISFSMVFMHPYALAVSLICAFVYSIILGGAKAIKFNLIYMLPVAAATALINPVFNHAGATVLGYLPGGNPLTLEAILYGVAAGAMLWSVICHFSCFNKIMTEDKLTYLFGRLSPTLSLIFSMVLRFVPRFKAQLAEISAAQRFVGADVSQGSLGERVKNGIKILSVMITRSMENAVDTADSMKSRGYGLPKRSFYSSYTLTGRDICSVLYMAFLIIYIAAGGAMGAMGFEYYPSAVGAELTAYGATVFGAYLMLFLHPVIIEVWEAAKWKQLKSKL